MHPEVQARAQKEIDAVLGGNRLPLYEDEERLPYIAAILREVLRYVRCLLLILANQCKAPRCRWQPSTPLGTSTSRYHVDLASNIVWIAIPHFTTADDEYRGYAYP